jgi:hypothetical protein
MILIKKGLLMKYLTLFYEGNKIEIHNSHWGKEAIYYNGELVSSRRSLFGSIHQFQVQEKNEDAEYKIDIGYNSRGIAFSVYRNESPLLIQ